jgi:uncharacterized protein YkwD
MLLPLACTDDLSDKETVLDTASSLEDTDSTDMNDTASTEDTPATDPSEKETVCTRWTTDRADLSEGAWIGNTDTCDAGELSQNGIDNALRLVNLYRWLSGLPEVEVNSTLNSKAQECALMMHDYGGLSHNPTPDVFGCYSEDGSEAAGKSNLSPYAGVYSVDLYMSDPGNETTLGHRRWILSNGLGPIGLGSTSEYSCMYVIGGAANDTAAWAAWPPAGVVPYELMNLAWATLEETGWSLQSDSVDLTNAMVTLTLDDGTNLPVTVNQLGEYYGSKWAISMVPNGWFSEPGRSYDVHVEATGGVIDYTVDLVDCVQ